MKRKILVPVLIILGVLFIVIGIFYGVNKKSIDFILSDIAVKKEKICDNSFKRTGYTTIYDKNDKVINKLIAKDYFYINKKDVPGDVSNAFIAIEDKNFKKHGGISVKGTFRALFVALKNKGQVTQGGSTITQQLVKNVFLNNSRTFSRKFEEIILSMNVEHKYDKDKIMEFYLNNIYFGNGAFGIETASRKYFSKSLKHLTLSEQAFLAAIPNSPVYYDPIIHKSNTITRRNLILKAMLDGHYINKADYNTAKLQEIKLNVFNPQPVKDDYLTSTAINSAVKELMLSDGFNFKYEFKTDAEKKAYQKKYSETYADYDKKLRSGGYDIHTSLDVNKQKLLQDSINNGLKDFSEKDPSNNKFKMQGAGVSIDNETGYIVAAVGGRAPDDQFNRAFLSYRQPGSAIKPVLAYAPAFDNRYHPLSHIVDQFIPNGPKNAENAYFGNVSLRYAVEMSLNTIPYFILNRLSPEKSIPYLLKMQFAGIYREDYNAITAVGGFTKGVSPEEMAGAYSTLEHDGGFAKNTCIKKIISQNGDIIVENKNKLSRKKVYTPESAYMMTDILKGVLTKQYATGYGLSLNNGHIAAGKTGTTEDSKDGWFCGYTKYYTTAIWCGYDTPESIKALYGATYPGHIWKDYMDKVHVNLKPKNFEKPSTVVFKNINEFTGEMVNYDSGVQDMFSQPVLDAIKREKEEAAAREKERQRLAYKAKEPERQAKLESDVRLYESSHYETIESLSYMDSLLDKMNSELKGLLDKDKINEFSKRIEKRTEELKNERQSCEAKKAAEEQKLQEEQAEKIRQEAEQQEADRRKLEAEQQKQDAEQKKQDAERQKKQLLDEQKRINSENQKLQTELLNEKSATDALKVVLAYPPDTKKEDPNFINSLEDAKTKIAKVSNAQVVNNLLQSLNDKVNMLK